MRISARLLIVVSAMCLVATWTGCRHGVTDKDADGNAEGQTTEATSTGTGQETSTSTGTGETTATTSTSAVPVAPEPAPAPTIPEVSLTDALRATCLVQVGDTMPEGQLPGLDGQTHALRDLYGSKLTVLCFWSGGDSAYAKMFASGLLEDLSKDIIQPYGDQGVRAIAVNEGDSAEAVGQLATTADASALPIFLDPGGTYFAQVAGEKLPRIYLLDAQGKILWFDMEYSETTRQQLHQAVEVVLGEK